MTAQMPDVACVEMEPLTLATTLRTAARKYGDRVCLRTLDGAAYSYAEILRRSEVQAAGLADLGVGAGDPVVVIMDNSVEMVIAWFAINLLGAVEVPSNTANLGTSLEHVMNNSGAKVAMVDGSYAQRLVDISSELEALTTVVCNGPVADLPWDTVSLASLAGDASTVPSNPVSYRDPASIIYTSGTTGPAKGVLVPHGHMHTFARHVVDQLEITEDDVYFVCLPMFHANAQFMQILPCVMTGATIVLAGAFSASRWALDLEVCGATVTSLLGVMAQYIFDQPPSPQDQAHQVRRMITIPMPAAIAHDFERRFDTTCVGAYGMTEVCLPIYRPLNEPLRPGSCGKALDRWFEVRVVDPVTEEHLPDGEVGEIVVRPRLPFTTFLGYHKMPERTVEAWRNLWFHTGDAGRRDAEGYFYFGDRLNDRIRRKGENVTSYDIEVALAELPEVDDAAVIAVRAAEGEDDIKAFLVIAEGVEAPEPLDLLKHCVRRLPYFAVPRYFEFLEDLPKTATGKVLKRDLRKFENSDGVWDRELAGWTVKRGCEHPIPLQAADMRLVKHQAADQ